MQKRKQSALVLGGSGDIGAACCLQLAQEGWDVAIGYHKNAARAESLANDVKAMGRAACAVQTDLADECSLHKAVAAAEMLSPLGTVVFLAGPTIPQRLISTIEATDMAYHIDQEAMGLFRAVKAALPALRANAGAFVIALSCAQLRVASRDGLSLMAKFAMEGLMKTLAKEEGRFGLRANGIAIGLIDAGAQKRLQASGDIDENYLAQAIKTMPLRRLGQSGDIAHCVAFLADGRKSGFMTGQIIAVDGGYSL